MKKRKFTGALCAALAIYTFFIPISASAIGAKSEGTEYTQTLSEGVEVGSRFAELLLGTKEKKAPTLRIGGGVFGVKIAQKNVTVTESSGIPLLKTGDIILSINGKEIHCVEDVKNTLQKCGGDSVTICALHRGERVSIEVKPTLSDGEYKLGLSVRDGASGIGTVTFYDEKTGLFGGLGHGICDSETGEVISMSTGEVMGVVLGGVHKGECGKPGELTGILKDKCIGTLHSNNECGVFGIITDKAAFEASVGAALPIGTKSEVKAGEAKIVSTLKNGKNAEYSIEIYDVDKSSDGSKSFKIRVTDPTLVAISGGIVRGMSGSPIIQNGKLVGAVTHVMIADPTEGYGIFIENMLNAAQSQLRQKAA